MGSENYVLDKILKLQMFDENGNVIAEFKGLEETSVSYDSRDEEIK
jgi:hypothetical protein